MDFFEHQDRARARSRTLVVYFALAVIGIILATYLAFITILPLAAAALDKRGKPPREIVLWQPRTLGWVTLVTLAIVSGGSLFKIIELSSGGGKVAALLGGRLVGPRTNDPDERRLLNVVEEMAIASGVPVPEVYVMDAEKAINAFAAGTTTANAAIGVTRGTIQLLTRDELQGVIAHEFSHILNGDMRLNIRLMGLLNGILCLAILGRILLYLRGGRRNPLPLLGIALLAIGGIGLFFGKLIKSATSRQREFLADASAVQFTRNPDGIVGALKKIGGLTRGSRLRIATAEEASHMFFGDGVSSQWHSLFPTHPPLAKRIRAIDPTFDGRFPRIKVPAQPGPAAVAGFGSSAGLPGREQAGAQFARTRGIDPTTVSGHVGNPTHDHLMIASRLMSGLPEEIVAAARDPVSACGLTLSLLLDADEATRKGQWALLKSRCHAAVFDEVRRLSESVLRLNADSRLPVLDLAIPALRQLSPPQSEELRRQARLLIESDRQIDLFEYALERTLGRQLHWKPETERPRTVTYSSLKPLAHDGAVLLSGVARLAHEPPPAIQQAFESGVARLGLQDPRLVLLDFSQCNLTQMDDALGKLAGLVPALKNRVIDALAHVVASDGRIECREMEMLRAVAETLDCPIPPIAKA